MYFVVFGKKYKVEKINGLSEKNGAYGIFTHKDKKIQVDSSVKGKVLIHTYLHELIHAVVDRLGLESASLSCDLEEILAENIPEAILDNFEVKLKCKKRREE